MSHPDRFLPYRVLRRLDRPPALSTWLAEDPRLGRVVVLEAIEDPGDAAQLEAEARRLASLSHPHIVGIHALERAGDRPFLVREHVDGESLRAVFALGPLPASEVAILGAALADALAHAHARGVVHGALGPDSVLVDEHGRARILHFGLAPRTRAPATGAEGAIERAPELSPGDAPTPASDVWSLGRLLEQALLGAASADRPAASAERPAAPGDRVHAGVLAQAARARAADPGVRPDPAAIADALSALVKPVRRRRRLRRRTMVVAVFAVTLAAIAAFRLVGVRRVAASAPNAVYVAPMRVVGRADRYLGLAFSRQVVGALSRVKPLQVLPLVEGAGADEPSVMAEARRRGARWAVWGTVALDTAQFRASVSLVEVPKNRLAWAVTDRAPSGDVAIVTARLAREIAGALHSTPPARYDHYLYSVRSQALATSPEMSEALGLIRRYGIRSAADVTRRLVERFPDEPEVRVLDLRARMDQAWEGGQSSPHRRAYERALAELRRVDPMNPWADVFEALVAHRDGQPNDAITRYGRVLARDDLTPAARSYVLGLRGQARVDVPDREHALADFEQAVRLDGMNAQTLAMYAEALRAAGHGEEALERARQAVALAPGLSYGRLMLSRALGRFGRWPEAAYEAARAVELRPVHSFIAWQALALRHAGREAEAVAAAARAAAMEPSDWGAAELARFHALGGDAARACAEFARAMELGYLDAEAPVAPEFSTLRGTPEWDALMERLRARQAARARPLGIAAPE